MAPHVAQDVRLVATLPGAKVLGGLTALVSQVTLQAVLPLIVTIAVLANPRLFQPFRIHDIAALCQGLRRIRTLINLLR